MINIFVTVARKLRFPKKRKKRKKYFRSNICIRKKISLVERFVMLASIRGRIDGLIIPIHH